MRDLSLAELRLRYKLSSTSLMNTIRRDPRFGPGWRPKKVMRATPWSDAHRADAHSLLFRSQEARRHSAEPSTAGVGESYKSPVLHSSNRRNTPHDSEDTRSSVSSCPTLPPTPLHNLALTIAALAASALAYALAAFRVAASSAAARTPPCRSSLETSGAKSCPDLATSAARARTRCSCCR